MAPEILLASRGNGLPSRHGTYGKEVDVWAAGVVTYVLLFGRYPFHHHKRSEWHKRIVRAEYTFPADTTVSDSAKAVIAELLNADPRTRMTASDALQMEWFSMNPPACEKTTAGAPAAAHGVDALVADRSSLPTPGHSAVRHE